MIESNILEFIHPSTSANLYQKNTIQSLDLGITKADTPTPSEIYSIHFF